MIVKTSVELKFNIKITDLSDLENPFVIYENKKIDDDGYIIFDNLDFNPFANNLENHSNAINPLRILPWLANPGSSLEKRTLKIEVTYLSELVLLRFIHLDRFYPVKYPKIMLEIANNIGQNQYLLMKQNQARNRQQNDVTPPMTLGPNSSIDSDDAVLMMRRVEFKQNTAAADHNNLLLQNEKVKMSLELPGTQTFSSTGGQKKHNTGTLDNVKIEDDGSLESPSTINNTRHE